MSPTLQTDDVLPPMSHAWMWDGDAFVMTGQLEPEKAYWLYSETAAVAE